MEYEGVLELHPSTFKRKFSWHQRTSLLFSTKVQKELLANLLHRVLSSTGRTSIVEIWTDGGESRVEKFLSEFQEAAGLKSSQGRETRNEERGSRADGVNEVD